MIITTQNRVARAVFIAMVFAVTFAVVQWRYTAGYHDGRTAGVVDTLNALGPHLCSDPNLENHLEK
jgi:hypothetical protein